jgi:putative peptide zinc metalloprotease protein
MRVLRTGCVLAATLTLVATAPAAYADEGGGPVRHVVFATSFADRPVVERSSVVVVTSQSPDLTAVNVANAYAHDCTGCRSVAIAFQAVLVPRSVNVATPRNVAFSLNLRCTGCVAFAFADQYVVQTDGVKHLTKAAADTVEAIRAEADRIAESGLDPATMDLQLKGLQERFHAAVLAGIAP